jgi:hypothetical protein
MKRFDVQILVRGEWLWLGVAPTGLTQRAARHLKARAALHPYWRDVIGATKFRVVAVPEAA